MPSAVFEKSFCDFFDATTVFDVKVTIAGIPAIQRIAAENYSACKVDEEIEHTQADNDFEEQRCNLEKLRCNPARSMTFPVKQCAPEPIWSKWPVVDIATAAA